MSILLHTDATKSRKEDLKKVYFDTAVATSRGQLHCLLEMADPDKILFGRCVAWRSWRGAGLIPYSDYPYNGNEVGSRVVLSYLVYRPRTGLELDGTLRRDAQARRVQGPAGGKLGKCEASLRLVIGSRSRQRLYILHRVMAALSMCQAPHLFQR